MLRAERMSWRNQIGASIASNSGKLITGDDIGDADVILKFPYLHTSRSSICNNHSYHYTCN